MTRMQQMIAAIAIAVVACAVPAAAQEMVVSGPPPVLRARLDAFVRAFNSGDVEQWEKMAAAAFTPAYLKSQTAAERQKAFLKMRADFGTIALERVERNGPDAPLTIAIKGSVASGTMTVELDEEHRFNGLKASVAKAATSPSRARRRP